MDKMCAHPLKGGVGRGRKSIKGGATGAEAYGETAFIVRVFDRDLDICIRFRAVDVRAAMNQGLI